jgi:DNA-binding Xre family transcriptional regulator
MPILSNIEAERARNNQSLLDLAKSLGVTERTLFSWIHMITPIPSTKLLKMCKLWNCSSDYLLAISNDGME